jgi:hypothetical protein
MMRDERGVALVTVLFIGAVMTVTVSAAAFIAVGEFRASNRDRGATTALALSEAGIDRTIQWIRSNKVPWRFIALSGCSSVGTVGGVSYSTITLNGQIGTGTYATTITRADGCSPLPTSVPNPRVPQQLVLSSTGCTDNAAGVACPTGSSKRLVEQAVAVTSRTLPVGMSAASIDMRGSPSFQNMIVVARGIVSSRSHINVTGTDPYYKKSDFYPCIGGKTAAAFQCFTAGAANDTAMPASVHSTDRIYTKPNGGDEHPPSPNCSYLWDGSATGTTITGTACGFAYPNRPPTALFSEADADRITNTPRLTEEDHLYFKNVAQQAGLYCSNYGTGTASCTRAGTAATVTGDIDTADVTGLGGFYVVYIEYPGGSDPQRNMLGWNVAAPTGTNPCSSTAATGSMVVVIVRNGGLETKSSFIGAIFAEDGRYETGANASFEGTVAAQFIRTRGSPNICNSQRWLDSMPGIFISVAPLQWSEVDR